MAVAELLASVFRGWASWGRCPGRVLITCLIDQSWCDGQRGPCRCGAGLGLEDGGTEECGRENKNILEVHKEGGRPWQELFPGGRICLACAEGPRWASGTTVDSAGYETAVSPAV